MAGQKVKPVFLEDQCLRSLITSAMEVYNRETNGLLIGRNTKKKISRSMRKVMSIRDVYPYQTDIRKPSEVSHGNMAAFRRVISSISSMQTKIAGGYHSHCWPIERIKLSKSDIGFSKDEMGYTNKNRKNGLTEWLEILLSVKKREYTEPHEIGWFLTELEKGVRSLIVMNTFEGYSVTINAYWIKHGKKPTVREAKVYASWLV